jgi:hypothetical protein
LGADANDSRECSISAEQAEYYHNHKEKLKIGSQPHSKKQPTILFILL